MGRVKRTKDEAERLIAAHRSAPRRKRGRPEALIQASIVAALKRAGFAVYSTSQGYRAAPGGTRMTPGLPDLYAILPKWRAIWVEVKSTKGQVRDAQRRFADQHDPDIWSIPRVYLWRSVDDCLEWMQGIGLMQQRPDGAWRFPFAGGAE